jgi:hypothetical protein
MTQPLVPAASPYTASEIAAVVTRLVQSSITYPIDTLGVRRTDLTFNDFQQAAANIFILNTNAPFYVLWLGAQRLSDAITAEATICASLVSAIQALGVPVTPITDVSTLFNAQAALANLGAAAAQRGGTFTNIQSTPGFQQLMKNTQSFLKGPGQNVVQQGQIVQTPQQARAAIPGLVSQLKTAHAALIVSVNALVNGIENYNSLNLPAVVSASVLANASTLVGNDANAMNSLTPSERLAQVRQVVLDLIATNTVVSNFCSFSGPSQFIALTGTGMPYSDAAHLATPALAVATIGGGVAIVAGVSDDLNLTMDGGTPFDLTLNPSQVATLLGQLAEPFLIGNGTTPASPYGPPNPPPDNNKFQLQVGATTYTATLGTGLARTAVQVCSDINGGMPANITASPYYSPLYYSGGINIVAGTDTTWTLPVAGITDFVALGVTSSNSTVTVASGPNAGTYPITGVTSSTITVTGTFTGQLNVQVEVGATARKVQVAINDPVVDVPLETTITVLGTTTVEQACAQTLGLIVGTSSSCKLSTPDVVSAYINTITQQVTAGTQNQYDLIGVPAHSVILSTSELVFAEAESSGSQSFSGFFPFVELRYTVTSITVAGTISVGDTIALRSGNAATHGYDIVSINGHGPTGHQLAVGDVILATGSFSGSAASSIDAEFGPTITAHKYDVVNIPSGPNEGTYFVLSNGDTSIDIILQQPLPMPMTATQQPVDVTANYGAMYLTLASSNQTTQSAVRVQGTAGALFFSHIPFTQLGTTPYFQLPSIPQQLQTGDMLYTYATQYNEPSAIYVIIGVQPTVGTGVIEIQPDIPDGVSWVFTPQPPPYAALAYGVNNDYLVVQGEWQTWLAAPPQQPNWFTNFNAVLNPVLVNDSPRAVDIGNAVNYLNQLYALLQGAQATALQENPALALDIISASFTVEPVAAIDTMVTTYSAKGADLAVDTLLSGDFATFFNMTSMGSSYGGAMQMAIQAVAQNDLPVRKINRSIVQTSQVIAQTVSVDPEYPAATGVSEQLQQEQVNPPAALGSGVPSSFGTTIETPATATQQTANQPIPGTGNT